MPFGIDDIILFGLFGAPIAGLLGLKKTSEHLDDSGPANRSYSQTTAYSPPPYTAPQPYAPPPSQGYGDGEQFYGSPYDGGYSPYEEMPYQQQGFHQPQNEVVLYSQDGGRSFYANVGYNDRVMNMHVDTGATTCTVGDEVWNWLRKIVPSEGSGTATIANGKRVSVTNFTFPYLTVIGADNQSFVTVTNVPAMYLPGGGCLLGTSFLNQTHYSAHGHQMIIRG